MEQLLEWNKPVDIQGFDIRIFNEEQGEDLTCLKHYQAFKFAWDNPKDNIDDKIELLLNYIKPYKLMCYILIGFNSTIQEDYERARHLWEDYKIHPFAMPYNKQDQYQKDFARWCNNKFIFKKASWFDYQKEKGRIWLDENYRTNPRINSNQRRIR